MSATQLSNQRLLAFVTDPASADAVRAVSGAQLQGGDAAAATEFLRNNPSPQALLVEIPSADAAPKLLDALADRVHPSTKVIITGKVDTLSFYQWLMGLGIQEYLLAPFTATQLEAALNKPEGGVAAAAAKTPTGKLVAVIGARGGVGTSTIATNLAALFALEQKLPTALVDLDPHFGSVALGLDLEPGRGMRDALEQPDRVDGLFLDRVLIKPFANLSILSAEEPLQETLNPQANAGQVLFSALGEKFRMVVADLPRQMGPLTRHVLAHADKILLVSEPHLIDLRDALRLKDYVVEQLKRPAPLLVINREGIAGKQELSMGDYAKHYGGTPTLRLKFLADAYAASAQGELLVKNPKLASALEPLRSLAAKLSGVAGSVQEEKPRKSFFKGKA